MADRPDIPAGIQREVRQRCGFGCVICGCPVYEYDHIVEWSETKHHKADELTLLCIKHHGEKTKKILPVQKVKEANAKPHNISEGVSNPQTLYYSGSSFKLKLGDSVSTYSGLQDGQTFFPFVIDGEPIVSFTNEGGNIFLNVEIRDEAGQVIFRVEKSELTYSTGLWDIEWAGQVLTIRERLRKILLEIEFNPPNQVSINRGSLHFNGVEIEIGKDYIYCLNNQCFLGNCQVHGAGYGFAIGNPVPEGGSGIVFSGVPRPVPDRDAAKEYLRRKIKEIRAQQVENLKREKQERLKDKNYQPQTLLGKLKSSAAPIAYMMMGVI